MYKKLEYCSRRELGPPLSEVVLAMWLLNILWCN